MAADQRGIATAGTENTEGAVCLMARGLRSSGSPERALRVAVIKFLTVRILGCGGSAPVWTRRFNRR